MDTRRGGTGAITSSLDGLKRRLISVVSCSFSCVAALCVFVATNDIAATLEVRACAAAIAACSVVSLLTRRVPVFLAFHGVRALLSMVILLTKGSVDVVLELLLLLPFILETALYLKPALAVPINLFFIACIGVLDAHLLQYAGLYAMAERCGPVVLSSIAFLTIGSLLLQYRESTVRKSKRLREYELAMVSLESANREYLEYADRIESISEDKERKRITREIHDTIGYALANIQMLAQAAKAVSRAGAGQLDSLLDEIRNQSNTLLGDSRAILYRLRSVAQQKAEYMSAVHHLARSLRDATDMEVEVVPGNAPKSFSEAVDKAIVRLVQEGITNAIRHGMAKKIRISFWLTDSELQIRVWDNGVGSENVIEGIGFKGMRERLAVFGGGIEARTVADGFLLEAHIPARELSHGEE